MVEAQHIASTMKLVDDAGEQQLLERLLEGGKPPLPPAAAGLDYLLATPFRYPPRAEGSRFRASTDPGVFYGAGEIRTACAELGYWRWRFLRDAIGLRELEPIHHTAFEAVIDTRLIDLREPPFVEHADHWQHPADYTATQALAHDARSAGVGGILYRSVRDPRPGWCLALLDARGFGRPKPNPVTQTWVLSVRIREVVWQRAGAAHAFDANHW
jgi:hypothetical protein